MRKLDEGPADAIVLAAAGLVRLGLDGRISERLEPTEFVPACGQGALAIEIRSDDDAARKLLAPLNDAKSEVAVAAERAMLAALGGGCHVPIGGFGRWDEAGQLTLTGMVASPDGKRLLRQTCSAPAADCEQAETLGRQVAEMLLADGSQELLDADVNQP